MLGRIWYATLNERLTSDATFDDFARATVDVAGELYGNGGHIQRIVAESWSSVGLEVPVFNAPGANANAVKELVLTALLLGARNVVPAIGYVASLDPAQGDLEARVEDGKTVRQRPLCAYPAQARYKGSGEINDAANFTCVTPDAKDRPLTASDMILIQSSLKQRDVKLPNR